MAKILFETQKEARELKKKVAVLESEARPLEVVGWILTDEGERPVLISMVSPTERVTLGLKGLFG